MPTHIDNADHLLWMKSNVNIVCSTKEVPGFN